MTHRDKAQAKSLEYARSEGWIDPVTARLLEQAHGAEGIVRNEAEAGADAMRIASLEVIEREYGRLADAHTELERSHQEAIAKVADLAVALETERESHAVTKRAVTRGTRARCAALEGAIRAISDAEKAEPSSSRGAVEAALNVARGLL